MFPTPNLDHLTAVDYQHVYEPGEDTFLLLDALEKEITFLKEQVGPTICLEIGSGSGCVATFLGQLLGDSSVLMLCTDINPHAAQITLKTGRQNSVALNAIITDLASGLLPRLSRSIDIIFFNPPYVVTTSDELSSTALERAWAGGVDGRQVIDRTLPLVNDLLSPQGVFYLLVISENKPDEVRNIMKDRFRFNSEVVLSRLSGREKQFVIKFYRE